MRDARGDDGTGNDSAHNTSRKDPTPPYVKAPGFGDHVEAKETMDATPNAPTIANTGGGGAPNSPRRLSAAGGTEDPKFRGAKQGQHRKQLSPEEIAALREQHRLKKEAEEKELELKYGADHVVALIIPVSVCMLAVIATVKSVSYYDEHTASFAYTPYESNSANGEEESDGAKISGALLNVLIVLAIIVGMTFGLVLCYKYKWWRAMNAWLVLSTLMIMGYFTYEFLTELLWAHSVPMSWPTLIVIVWNFGVGGMFAIHWKSPLRINQFYLIAVSVLMALILIKYLPDWTTWLLLGAVATYDLVAVLCPCGPLHMLIHEVQASGRAFLPELVYSSTILFPVAMMAPPKDAANPSSANTSPQNKKVINPLKDGLTDANLPEGAKRPAKEAPSTFGGQVSPLGEQIDEEEEDTGVKLGLGDFIFYSVLVGKAATQDDWGVVVACYVAIIVGLTATIFILSIFKKALPALPISIFTAMLFYFVSRYTLVEYLQEIVHLQLII
eukprot:m.246807 g.246807  ORF g.246807 m.246807 type:complete len:500 (-) comp19489_c0_seq46:2101-3600(-)